MLSHDDYFSRTFEWGTEEDTCQFAKAFAKALQECWHQGVVVYLEGDLGAGKTHFSRALIQYFIPNQRVKSPTYTLVESYPTELGTIYHFDLYRLCDPEELEFLGVRDLLTPPYLALIEWPSKAKGVLPEFDIKISIKIIDMKRIVEVSAKVNLAAVVKQIEPFQES